MKKISILISGVFFITFSGCKKYLDINNNPNGPSQADPALYIPAIQKEFAQGLQFDSRLIGAYVQNFLSSSASSSVDLHGYSKASDFGGSMWRSVYWKGGQNLIDLKNNATAQKKWDILGVGLALEAFGWQMLSDYHGPIIFRQAFDPARNIFDYDDQDTVYAGIQRISMEAIAELSKSGDAVGSSLFSRFDQVYQGNRTKWQKFAYGLLAINAHHLIKKGTYNPDDVIKYVDLSFSGNADDAIVPFTGTIPDDASGFGPLNVGTNTLNNYGQSSYIVRLTDGSVLGTKDPRQVIMLTPSTDGVYRGLTPGGGQTAAVSSSSAGVRSLFGTTMGASVTQSSPGTIGKYLFHDRAGYPLISYAELQFIKAEAAFKKGDKALALTAYKAGVNASLDYVRSFTTDAAQIATYNTQRTAYLADANIIPVAAANLTVSQILLQKYIALWGWGFTEIWTDLRKYDYDGTIFTSFTLPTTFFTDNNGKPAYRVRPRYNSEYLWNIDALTKIGGFDADYHTKKIWIQLP